MVYLYLSITQEIDGFEFVGNCVAYCPNKYDLESFLENIHKDFLGPLDIEEYWARRGRYFKDDNYFYCRSYLDYDGVRVYYPEYKEISKEDYLVLRKYLPDLR